MGDDSEPGLYRLLGVRRGHGAVGVANAVRLRARHLGRSLAPPELEAVLAIAQEDCRWRLGRPLVGEAPGPSGREAPAGDDAGRWAVLSADEARVVDEILSDGRLDGWVARARDAAERDGTAGDAAGRGARDATGRDAPASVHGYWSGRFARTTGRDWLAGVAGIGAALVAVPLTTAVAAAVRDWPGGPVPWLAAWDVVACGLVVATIVATPALRRLGIAQVCATASTVGLVGLATVAVASAVGWLSTTPAELASSEDVFAFGLWSAIAFAAFDLALPPGAFGSRPVRGA